MTSKLPPIPRGNRSPKGPPATAPYDQAKKGRNRLAAENPDKRGQTANTKQNTTNQGYQQDR
jgi:hypothetical protein